MCRYLLGGRFLETDSFVAGGENTNREKFCFLPDIDGWDAGQLDRELDENSWMVGDITPARFFEIPNDNLWEASMSGLGGRYRIWANFPKDPIMN